MPELKEQIEELINKHPFHIKELLEILLQMAEEIHDLREELFAVNALIRED